ncbi:MAG TPA: TlpA disulfide reductase family protein [Candidatus Angelobacter sp.]
MHKFASSVLFILAATTLGVPSAPVPRKAPDLSFVEPSGNIISLSTFKGKVVALEFFFVRSVHCLRVAQTLNKLNDDLGPRGFQPLAVAFPAPSAEADAATVLDFVESYRIAFPVGYTQKEAVDRFVGRDRADVSVNIPQVVIIDRAGMIRAQSGDRPGDPRLEDGNSLRALLDGLLKENPQTMPAKQASSLGSGKINATR